MAEETSVPENEPQIEIPEDNPKKKDNLKKDKGQKQDKLTKDEKKARKQAAKDEKKAQKEWEEQIAQNKRVKAEERRKKVKRAMLVILVFALISTSVVYSTLLFIEENNVRITATSNNVDKSIALSIDGETWTPYLNGRGPENMSDITYYGLFENESHPWTKEEVYEILLSENPLLGNRNEDNYIAFMFLLKNTSNESAYVACSMNFEVEVDMGLQNATRVMWGKSFSKRGESEIRIFGTTSKNNKLASLKINEGRTEEDGYLENVAYPYNRDKKIVYREEGAEEDTVFSSYKEYEEFLTEKGLWEEAEKNGYFACEPFKDSEYVFKEEVELEKGEIMYCYVQIWIDGTDYDCTDMAASGKVKMGLDFTVVA